MMADEVNINCTDQNNNSLFETQNKLNGDEFIYYFLIFSEFCVRKGQPNESGGIVVNGPRREAR